MTDEIRRRTNIFREDLLNDDGTIMTLNDHLTKYSADSKITKFNYDRLLVRRMLKMYNDGNMEEFQEYAEIFKTLNVREIYMVDYQEELKEIKKEEERLEREKNKYKNFFDNFLAPETKERLHIVMGETGVGKSYMIERELPGIIQYACNSSLDPYTLSYELKDEGNGLQPFETPFLKAIKEGGKIFLDEMNELPMDTLMFIQGITDEKSSVVIGNNHINIHKDFRIIGSLNPPSATDERRPIGDALLGRAVGIVLELTDEIICERIGCTKEWLGEVRKLHNFMRGANFVDLRNLNFRDYQRLYKYDFEEQYKFKVCMGDVQNIAEYRNISTSYEFEQIMEKIKKLKE